MLVHVTWRVVVSPDQPIRCRRYCSRCGKVASFTSSGRFRVNANGKRLDAWLVYSCDGCGRSWCLEILERASVRTVPAATYQKLSQNDAGLARRCALDVHALRSQGALLDTVDFEVQPAGETRRAAASSTEITMSLPEPLPIRLDRVLAVGLGRPRREVRELGAQGRVEVVGAGALQRPVMNGQRVVII
jgi:hypothetical protein